MHTVASVHGSRAILQLGPYVSAILALAGVKLHMDWDNEVHYLEVHRNHSKPVLMAFLAGITACGLEVMPEDECPSEHLPDGTIRTWLAEMPDMLPLVSRWNELCPIALEQPHALPV